MNTTADEKTSPGPRAPGRSATFGEVFAVAEFRPLFGTFLLSTIGDELARVALTVLVYQRTASPLLAAVTFAISYLPWLLGGPLLSTLADRLPRHRVLISTDAIRAVLVAAMAVSGMPLPVLLALLFLVALCAPPFESARSALMADVLSGDRYAVATSLSNISLQLAQVVGYAAGGALIAVLHPSVALLIDAVTFAVSAIWLSFGLQRRPSPAGEETRSLWRDAAEGVRFIGRSPRLLAIIGVLWIATLFTFGPEGVAAPLVVQLGKGTAAIGILLAANPFGVTLGGIAIARFVRSDIRERLIPGLVVLSLAPVLAAGLVAVTAGPGTLPFAVVVALLFVSGLGSAWMIPLNVSFVQAVPAAFRGRAFGVAVSGLNGVQGIGVLLAGVAAEAMSPAGVLALYGGVGLLAVVVPLIALTRTRGHMAADVVTAGPSKA
jgi:Major Facilitator Superfamily